MVVIRKINSKKACYQAVTKTTTKNDRPNNRFGIYSKRK